MSKTAVVFWSATGNTEAMADAVKEGAAQAGAEVIVFSASDFSADKAAEFDSIAFGCPAMGDEVLEEDEFQPMFDAVLPALKELGRRSVDARLGGNLQICRRYPCKRACNG